MKSPLKKPRVDASQSVAQHLTKSSTSQHAQHAMQFKDERDETAEARSLAQQLIREKPMAEASMVMNGALANTSDTLHGPQAIQRAKRSDPGAGETKRLYADQVSATKTDAALDVLVLSSMKDSEGVFLSDDMGDWSQSKWATSSEVVNRLILPDYEALQDDASKVPDLLKNNGQSLLQNCQMVAEHELMHLKHSSENHKKKNGLGAQTALEAFDDTHIEDTVKDLKDDINDIYIGPNRVNPILRLERMQAFIDARLDYIVGTWRSKGVNVEAPTVLRELRRYLDNTLQGNEGETWTNFQTKIKGLDDKCSELVGAKIGGCYLTEACTKTEGLPDHCIELTLLRQFRDTYLSKQNGGDQLIDIYYQYAPKILSAIRRRDDEDEILHRIYGIVQECVKLIQDNDREACFDLYCEMTYAMAGEFIPELMRQIERKVPAVHSPIASTV